MSAFGDFKKNHGGAGSSTLINTGTQTDHMIGVRDSYTPSYSPFMPGGFENPGTQFPLGHYYKSKSGKTIRVQSRYKQGDEYLLAGRSPEQIAQVQQSLSRAGMLKPGTFQPGALDANTRKGFTQLLGEANGMGMRWGDYLDQRVAITDASGGPVYSGSAGAVKAPLEIKLTNSDSIKNQVTGTGAGSGRDVLGSTIAAGDPQHYVDEIHAAETKNQTDIYNQTGAGFAGGTGGAVEDPPTVADLMQKEHPAAAAVQGLLGTNAQQLISTLGGGVQAGMS